jgi:hypothetical protein
MQASMGAWLQRSRRLLTLAIGLAALFGAVPGAQTPVPKPRPWTPPVTEWGDPDLQGIWNYATMTPLERPRDFSDKATLSDEEAAAYEQQTNTRQRTQNSTAGPDWWDPGTRRLLDRRTSLIVDPPDGRLPPTTPEAQARAARATQARRSRGEADGPEEFSLSVRCLSWGTAGPPMLPGVYNNNVQFVQTRRYIAVVNEMIHDARLVHMDGRPHAGVPQWMGDSRGHWEGRTLVVDTADFSQKTSVRGSDDHLHLTERFTRTGPDTIEYQFTVDDPTVWTRSWTVAFPLRRTDDAMFEYACHEGNAPSIEGMLRAARLDDHDKH